MFGYKFFQNSGEESFNTPKEFQLKARQDIKNHIQQIRPDDSRFNKLKKYNKNAVPISTTSLFKQSNKSNNRNNTVLQQQIRAQQSHLTHGSSPLRKTITVSSNDSLSDTSSISSDHSGHSINNSNMTILSNNNLNRINTSSTFESSIFTNQLSAIYTNTTVPSTVPTFSSNNNNNSNNNIQISLNDALPKDYATYYSPDLDVPRFSNNRPTFTRRNLKNWEINDIRSLLILPCTKKEWNNCIPEIISPYPNLFFQIQILPLESTDGEYAEFLSNCDIYKESKFDQSFKYNTACYIVQQARIRHKLSLISTYGLNESAFDEFNLLGNLQYDCFDKIEWRNVIENYLLNLGIENQCRIEFKTRINKLEKLNKGNSRHQSDDLYKKVLIKDKFEINNQLKQKIWGDVQKFVYENIEI